ncbi:MAG: hypothetical protein JWR84_3268 [Caulobacter sp.]|nr:hypothetical protein [Caulobacter sp.]
MPINPKSHADHYERLGPDYVEKMILDREVSGKSLEVARDYIASANRQQTLKVARETSRATLKGAIIGGLIGAVGTMAVAWGPILVKSAQQTPVVVVAQTAKPPLK